MGTTFNEDDIRSLHFQFSSLLKFFLSIFFIHKSQPWYEKPFFLMLHFPSSDLRALLLHLLWFWIIPRGFPPTKPTHYHVSSSLILHILISKCNFSKFLIFKTPISFKTNFQNSNFQLIFKTSIFFQFNFSKLSFLSLNFKTLTSQTLIIFKFNFKKILSLNNSSKIWFSNLILNF